MPFVAAVKQGSTSRGFINENGPFFAVDKSKVPPVLSGFGTRRPFHANDSSRIKSAGPVSKTVLEGQGGRVLDWHRYLNWALKHHKSSSLVQHGHD